MRLLALDAALEDCSAALLDDGVCIGWEAAGDSRRAAASLPPVIEALLARHGRHFDAVAVTTGPGSFTGLRGSIGLAHGLALAAGVALSGVGVAEALLPDGDPGVWVVLDSRRAGRVFVSRNGAVTAVSLDDPPVPPPGVALMGNGAALLAEALAAHGIIAMLRPAPAMSAIATGIAAWRGRGGAPGEVQPLYVDPPQARPASAQRPGPV